jgi:hypothetical protein
VVAAFIKPDAPEGPALVSEIQKLSDKNGGRGLRTFVVMMAGPESKGAIDKLTAEKKISIPVTFLPAGPSQGDILKYQINPEARSTVLLWSGLTVRKNFANVTAEKWGDVAKAAEEMLK